MWFFILLIQTRFTQLLGLEHHFISGIEGKSEKTEPFMVEGGFRDDTATRNEFLPKEIEYPQLHMGSS